MVFETTMTQQSRISERLILNGEYERVWQRHCGFLDLSLDEFMDIQWRLLEEQFMIANKSKLWRMLFNTEEKPVVHDNYDELPLTNYSDYEPLLHDKPEDILSRPIEAWARTSGRGGKIKWVPFTPEAYLQLGEAALGDAILATARHRGDVRVRPNDVVVSNLPSRPYLSGLAQVAVTEHIKFQVVPSINEFEEMTYQERNKHIFERAMLVGIDMLGSMTLVLVKMGELFETGTNRREDASMGMLHPRVLWRYLLAKIRAYRQGRSYVLPKDLWQLKGLMCGGADTNEYRERIHEYWGLYPHESYGCTEAGILAVQPWSGETLTFIPYTAFYEFIPESEWAAERLGGDKPTKALLMDQLEVGQRYEVVISNFYGGPFLRYRLHDLIEVVSKANTRLGINLPQVRFVGRSGDFIDLSGFAGLIDERQINKALKATTLRFEDWMIAKEIIDGEPLLHLYIELHPEEQASEQKIGTRFHEELKRLNPEYANIETMLGFVPVRVTVLPPQSFGKYIQYQVAQGADLAHLKPHRIQPSAEAIQLMLTQRST